MQITAFDDILIEKLHHASMFLGRQDLARRKRRVRETELGFINVLEVLVSMCSKAEAINPYQVLARLGSSASAQGRG